MTDEQLKRYVDTAYEMIHKGYGVSKIKLHLMNDGMKEYQFNKVKDKLKERITYANDIYDELAKEINTQRLNEMLERAIDSGDDALALKIVQEMNKLKSLYITQVKVDTTEYKLEL